MPATPEMTPPNAFAVNEVFGEFFDTYAPEVFDREGSAEAFAVALERFVRLIRETPS